MNFQDNLEKVRDLYVVLSFISIRQITLYFLVHYKNMEHLNVLILLLFFKLYSTELTLIFFFTYLCCDNIYNKPIDKADFSGTFRQ